MEKKKLLFINKGFQLGGIEMALANLVDEICDTYDVTLAIFQSQGPMRDRVPANVRLLKLAPFTEVLGMGLNDCKTHGTFAQKAFKVIGSVWAKLFGNTLPIAFALAFQKHVGEYDVVISYHQEQGPETLVAGFGEFALKKTTAKKKIAWIHADVTATGLATRKNMKTYAKFDQIVSVSKTAMEIFKAAYPSLAHKCDYCYNAIPVTEIMQKGQLEKNVFTKSKEDTILFSACRLTEEKGLIPALHNLHMTFKNNQNLKWFIAGVGPLEQKLRALIKQMDLEGQVFLLGFKKNPYPYIAEADFLFLPSLHESFSMVIQEAHVLGTQVIASDIPVMKEVSGENDYLCKNQDYATTIEILLKNNIRRNCSPEISSKFDWKSRFEKIMDC